MVIRGTRRAVCAIVFSCIVQLVAPVFWPASGATAFVQSDATVLDGTAEVDAPALANLAVERALLGGHWLAGVVRADGSYYYIYDPVADEYGNGYNEVRHAGTTYALYQLYGATQDGTVLIGAERAAGYIDANSLTVPLVGRAYVDPVDGIVKLGGQALALVALLERRRVTEDTAFDRLIKDLASFLLSMETETDRGRYYQSYDYAASQRLLDPPSNFYPGEALLALTRMAQQFPDGPYLDAAKRAANYIIHRKDGDLVALAQAPRDDHWLTIALNELYRLAPDENYATVVEIQGNRMLAGQVTAEESDPELIGAARSSDGEASFGSTATKGEALVAAWSLAEFTGNEEAGTAFEVGAQRNAQFLMRVQYGEENTSNFPDAEQVIGGWAAGTDDPTIRIDNVQHSISALLGNWSMTIAGDIPIATPIPNT